MASYYFSEFQLSQASRYGKSDTVASFLFGEFDRYEARLVRTRQCEPSVLVFDAEVTENFFGVELRSLVAQVRPEDLGDLIVRLTF